MLKSASFGVVHLGIAFCISYALTGDVAIAGAITLIEPLVNTFVHYFFDRWWGHPRLLAALTRWRGQASKPMGGGAEPAAKAGACKPAQLGLDGAAA